MNTETPWRLDSASCLIKRFEVQNFKSIRHQTLEFGRLNVLIGANGTGKSNLIDALQAYVLTIDHRVGAFSGGFGASFFLHRKNPDHQQIFLNSFFAQGLEGILACGARLRANVEQDALQVESFSYAFAPGVDGGSYNFRQFEDALWRQVAFLHLDNVSPSAPIKRHGEIDDNRGLHPDGSNLAACLYLISQISPLVFQNIEETIRRVAPSFGRFELAPSESNPDRIRLWWSDQESSVRYSPHSLSDGTLRFMALTALLMQPRERLPRLIILDEPELGLHPAAVQLLASMISAVSEDAQIIVSTQSTALVSQFAPEDIITVERRDGESVFSRLDVAELVPWLAEYSLGELWEKNVLDLAQTRESFHDPLPDPC